MAELLVKICTEPAARPSSCDPELADFDGFFEKAFARDPNARFQTARELATELSIVAGLPPPSIRVATCTTGRLVPFSSRPTFAPDRGSTDLVAIATIAAEAPAAAPEPEATGRSTAPSSPGSRETIPEGRLRPVGISQETLTDASRSLDVAHDLPSQAPRILRVWATAVLFALAGLVVGAVVALQLLSAPEPILAASSGSPPVVLAVGPQTPDAAAAGVTDAAALELPPPLPSAPGASKKTPRPALSAAPSIPSARSLPRWRPSSRLGI